jgi:hypothetical protein
VQEGVSKCSKKKSEGKGSELREKKKTAEEKEIEFCTAKDQLQYLVVQGRPTLTVQD